MNRQKKVANELRHNICEIIQRELKDHRIGFLTVTGVDISADLQAAKVYFTVYGDAEQKQASEDAIKTAAGFIRSQLGRRMRMRYTPVLEFRPDASVEYGQRIEDICRKIGEERKKDVS